MSKVSTQKKRYVYASEYDPDLVKGTEIGYYLGFRFHCNCGSVVIHPEIHFKTQKHAHWTQCQNKLHSCQSSCRPGSKDVYRQVSPKRASSPVKIRRIPSLNSPSRRRAMSGGRR